MDIYYLSQSYFELPKRTLLKKSNKKILFIQTIKHIESLYRDVAGYDMSYDENEQFCRKSWEEDFN